MRKPRTTILLLTAIVTVLGYTLRPKPVETVLSKSDFRGSPQAAIASIAAISPAFRGQGNSAVVRSGAAQISRTVLPATASVRLSDDASALVTEMCGLHLLARDSDLSLSSSEWQAFASAVLRIQAIRQTHEAQIATSQLIAPGHYRLEIPAYASVGDALREKFHGELRAELGETKAAEILAKLGGRLEGYFGGFGVSVQTLDIATSDSGNLSDMEITRTVTYWNSVEGGDRLTTQREVHFPAFEDPTGESWGALLAVVKA